MANLNLGQSNNPIKESEGIRLRDRVDTAKEATFFQTDQVTVCNGAITERIIFCIDCCILKSRRGLCVRQILTMISNYIDIKKTLSAKPAEFGIIFLGPNKYIPVTNKDALSKAMWAVNRDDVNDNKPYDLSNLFTSIASFVELPDSSFYSQELPPPHVYHLILLFARNRYIPRLEAPNSFYFLTENPYVALDIIYVSARNDKNNKQEKIAQALSCLISPEKGYFHVCEGFQSSDVQTAFNTFLGHPLVRTSQNKAQYKLPSFVMNTVK